MSSSNSKGQPSGVNAGENTGEEARHPTAVSSARRRSPRRPITAVSVRRDYDHYHHNEQKPLLNSQELLDDVMTIVTRDVTLDLTIPEERQAYKFLARKFIGIPPHEYLENTPAGNLIPLNLLPIYKNSEGVEHVVKRPDDLPVLTLQSAPYTVEYWISTMTRFDYPRKKGKNKQKTEEALVRDCFVQQFIAVCSVNHTYMHQYLANDVPDREGTSFQSLLMARYEQVNAYAKTVVQCFRFFACRKRYLRMKYLRVVVPLPLPQAVERPEDESELEQLDSDGSSVESSVDNKQQPSVSVSPETTVSLEGEDDKESVDRLHSEEESSAGAGTVGLRARVPLNAFIDPYSIQLEDRIPLDTTIQLRERHDIATKNKTLKAYLAHVQPKKVRIHRLATILERVCAESARLHEHQKNLLNDKLILQESLGANDKGAMEASCQQGRQLYQLLWLHDKILRDTLALQTKIIEDVAASKIQALLRSRSLDQGGQRTATLSISDE